jgi:hypothetical protein
LIAVVLALLLPQDAAALVEKLGSADVGERDEAARRLLELGKAAVPDLESSGSTS